MQNEDETLTNPAREAPANSSPDSSQEPFDSIRQARSKCLMNYQVKALSQHDPLVATIGGLTAGMVSIAHWLEDGIHEVIDCQPASLDTVRRVNPAIETHLRLLRQVERFVTQLQRSTEGTGTKTNS